MSSGYDPETHRDQVRALQITLHIARGGTEHASGLGVYRWSSKRSHCCTGSAACVPAGRSASAAYAGEGKSDAKDAYVIAETARLRQDLPAVDAGTDLVRNLAVLTAHRADLIADRVRMLNRLRDLMTSVSPSLERAFDYSSHKGALVLLTGYASPERIRRLGETRLAGWLRHRSVRDPAASPPAPSPRRRRS